MKKRILVVDDEIDLLEILDEFLTDHNYAITCAKNADEALAQLERAPFDLLLSDINMPGKKGFELIAEALAKYPSLKTALITAYDVRDYINLAKKYDVGNIIAKTTPFNFEELALLIQNIISEEVFGLDRYVKSKITTVRLRSSREIESTICSIIDELPAGIHKRRFRQALGEVIVNAVYYGAKNERGDRKSEWNFDVQLAPEEEILVSWGSDQEKSGVSVQDQKGRLKKKDVLYWLERNTTKGSNGLSRGLFDEHGKGIFITRETIDRLIINVKRSRSTELVMLNYHEGLYDGFRPLWIHEF